MQVEYPQHRWSARFLLLDMFEGLKTTLRELFKPKVTIRYPEERLDPANRFRGMFRFSYDRCIACKLCAVACPIDIIYIDVHDEQREIDGKMKKLKVLDRNDLYFNMQELEYWENKPEYPGLPEEEPLILSRGSGEGSPALPGGTK